MPSGNEPFGSLQPPQDGPPITRAPLVSVVKRRAFMVICRLRLRRVRREEEVGEPQLLVEFVALLMLLLVLVLAPAAAVAANQANY